MALFSEIFHVNLEKLFLRIRVDGGGASYGESEKRAI